MSKTEWIDLGLEEILRNVQHLDQTRIRVGVVGAAADRRSSDGRLTMGEVAIINTVGSTKMNIPPRRFAKQTLESREAAPILAKVAQTVLEFGIVDHALNQAGAKLAHIMRDLIYHGEFQGNEPTTIRKKGFDHPLLETGRLADAVGHELVRGDGDVLDSGAVIGDYEAFHIEGGGE